MLPLRPQEARSLKKEIALLLILSLNHDSLLAVQPAENEGNLPQRLSAGSFDESKASARKFA